MRQKTMIASSLCLVTGMIIWLGWAAVRENPPESTVPAFDTPRLREKRLSRESQTLERIRSAAQRKLPDVNLDQKERVVFSEIDPQIDELDVMEILLEIETEFGFDIPQDAITQRVGREHRRNLRSHLSLSLIAECVDAILTSPDH